MSYQFVYDSETNEYPRWEKVFNAQSGEVFSVVLSFDNSVEREQLTVEQAYEHMNNLLQFIRDRSSAVSIIGIDDDAPKNEFPFKGDWSEADNAVQEIMMWWQWAYYNDNFYSEEEAEEDPEDV